jgi:hypothetical protein
MYKYKFLEPVQLSKNLTYLWGKDSNMFPLLSSTEGQGLLKPMKPKALNDTQYVWDIMGRMKHTSQVYALYNTGLAKPGLGFSPFQVYMQDNWFIGQHGAMTADRQHLLRIQGEPTKQANGMYLYTFVIVGGNHAEYVSLNNFTPGCYWTMAAPSVAASFSDGNRSNSMGPAKMTNQFGFQRFSKVISGNIAHKATKFEFDLEGGGKTNLWMPFEMKLFEIDRRLDIETDLWTSVYNRDNNGQITLKDEVTGKPIPKGAGIFEILKSTGQYNTYSTLTRSMWDSIITNIFTNRVDRTPMEIILYTGAGGMRQFDNAMKTDAFAKGYFTPMGKQEIESVSKEGQYLTYGNYFRHYRTVDGYLLSVTETNFFNQGLLAESDRKNGRMVGGLPLSSYTFVFLDHSMTDGGERNVTLVCEEGRELLTGVYKGLTNLPAEWAAIARNGDQLSDRKDIATYEVMTSMGINMYNWTTSYMAEMLMN